ncbi:MAG: hypothetical protein AAGI30_14100 [Planctomycetota bacterium]
MVRKLVILVAVFAMTALAVLVLRQQRLLAAAEMTRAVERAQALERQTWRLRGHVMALSSPQRVALLVAGVEERLGRFEPITPEVIDTGRDDFAMVLDGVSESGGL